jgi:hypothetical protein
MNEQLARGPATALAPNSAARRLALRAGTAATAVAVGGALWDALKPQSGGSDLHGLAYVLAVTVIAGVLIFALLVPARITAGGTGLPLAILSVPLIYAFWSGLPIITAAAAVVLAISHRAGGGTRPGQALAAILISATVIAVTVIAVLFG